MPFALARHWDSLESPDYLDQPPSDEPFISELENIQNLNALQKEWLTELMFSTDHECQSILYAKSLLDTEEDVEKENHTTSLQNLHFPPTSSSRIHVRSKEDHSNLANKIPPPKPQRRIARLKNNNNENIGLSNGMPAYSTLDLIESCKFSDAGTSRNVPHSQSTFTLNHQSSEDNVRFHWTPPGLRRSRVNINNPSASIADLTRSPPSYEQLTIRVERDGVSKVVGRRAPALRHTIAVNQEDVDKARQTCTRNVSSDTNRFRTPSSPQSMHSGSTLSVDSGQCSGDAAMTSQHSFSSSRDDAKDSTECGSIYQTYQMQCLPGYARMASTMDHVLRTSSAIYSLLSTSISDAPCRDLVAKATVFIQILESSPCAQQLPKYDINVVKMQIADVQREDSRDETASPTQSHASGSVLPTVPSDYFSVVLRKMVEQVLLLFAKIISKYLTECGNKDRLLVIALEHLIHIALFGDELCLETIQSGGLSSLLKLIKQPSTPPATTRLLLRALAVLCGVSKGCLSLLSLGGLDIVLSFLSNGSSTACAIEAAGVLTQLTNSQHAFVRLQKVQPVVIRLLELVDSCTSGESLLLVSAALANVSLQEPQTVDSLYKLDAINRMIRAYHRPDCCTIFVQEQIVTIFSRLAARRYEEALIAQGAIPVLLEMLTVTDSVHSDYCRRIRYKAAVCIGTLSSTSIGLKALYNHQAYAIVCNVLEMENSMANPLYMICTNIRDKLENTYQLESAV